MSKKVIVISSSPRIGGNSDTLCDEFVKGALDADNAAVKYNLEEIRFHSCKACRKCKTPEMKCFQEDGLAEVLDKMMEAIWFRASFIKLFHVRNPEKVL